MINSRLFTPLLILAILLIALQLTSGIWLFSEKFGLLPSQVTSYFAGNDECYTSAKSIEGLLETAVPHFLAIGLSIFVYGHFLLFTNIISSKQKHFLITSLFISAFVDIASPFGIIYGYSFFAYMKLFAFFCFEFLMAILLVILFKAAYTPEHS